jgi:hypothetical protein
MTMMRTEKTPTSEWVARRARELYPNLTPEKGQHKVWTENPDKKQKYREEVARGQYLQVKVSDPPQPSEEPEVAAREAKRLREEEGLNRDDARARAWAALKSGKLRP